MSWPVLPHGFLGSSSGDNDTYQIQRSLRFNSADSAYLSRTPASAGNRKTWTWSGWAKRSGSSTYNSLWGSESDSCFMYWDNTLYFFNITSGGGILRTTNVFRDFSAWYHVVLAVDTTQATSANRVRIYVNNQEITTLSTATYPPQNGDTYTNQSSVASYVGANRSAGLLPFDGYLTEINFIDGQALTPSSFGETDAITGRWKAKAYSGTYGTNGFYLKFDDNSGTTATTLGKDSSGNGNNWTPNNFSVTAGSGNDSLTDSPTNYGTVSTTLTDDTYQISRSLRFNPADSAYLSRTPASAGNRKTWTWSGWVKRGRTGGDDLHFFGGWDGSNNSTGIYLANTGEIEVFSIQVTPTVYTLRRRTTALFRDLSAWYHIVLAVDTTQSTGANRAKLYVNGSEITSFSLSSDPSQNSDLFVNTTSVHNIGKYTWGNAGYFDGYLTEINFIDGQALTPDSFGVRDANTYLWKPKAYTGTYGTNGFYLNFSDNSGTTATTLGKDQAGSNNWTPNNFSVTAGAGNDSLVDTPTYYGTDAGAGGEARGDYATLDPLASIGGSASISNGNLEFSRGATIYSGARANYPIPSTGKYYFEVTGVTASSMTIGFANEIFTYGGTNRLAYDGSGVKINKAGTNSSYGASFSGTDIVGVAVNADAKEITFYKNGASQGLAFSGSDYTGFGQLYPYAQINDGTNTTAAFNFGQRPFAYAAPSGFRALRDYNKIPVPTGGVVRGNYATMNPLIIQGPFGFSLLDGNLRASMGTTTGAACTVSTIGATSGKWYAEFTYLGATAPSGTTGDIGVITNPSAFSNFNSGNTNLGGYSRGYSYTLSVGTPYKFNNGAITSYGSAWAVNDIIGVALDIGAGTLEFFRNGVSQGVAFTGLPSGFEWFFAVGGSAWVFACNFGQRPWAYDAPFGFLPLCTTLLPTPTIQKPNSYMDVVTYTGTGSSRSITGLGFSPDLVWIKDRSAANWHNVLDTIRGGNARLSTNSTNAEDTGSAGGATPLISAFNSDGFTLPNGNDNTNKLSNTYVSWAWDEAPIAGMDIVAYTGNGTNRTIAHNLGVAPKMIICKNKSQAIAGGDDTHWCVYHSSVGSGSVIFLNLTNAAVANTAFWNSTNPTSSVFSIGTSNRHNYNGDGHIAYLFAEVEGFSKFGSYTGNGSSDGPFVWCGFRPKYIMIKSSSNTSLWVTLDTARDTFNPVGYELYPNSSGAEGNAASSGGDFDYLSNGFKSRRATTELNTNGYTYIFAAFAESPFKYARAR